MPEVSLRTVSYDVRFVEFSYILNSLPEFW